jgi:hypothetical protein
MLVISVSLGVRSIQISVVGEVLAAWVVIVVPAAIMLRALVVLAGVALPLVRAAGFELARLPSRTPPSVVIPVALAVLAATEVPVSSQMVPVEMAAMPPLVAVFSWVHTGGLMFSI